MTSYHKRSRMVSIRLSDEEFKKLHDVCVSTGARSISDLAREAMHRLTDGNGHATDGLSEMQERLNRLEAQVASLSAAAGCSE